MKCFDLPSIRAALDVEQAVDLIEAGFVAHAAGQVQLPPVQAFDFAAANGDCCIKSAWLQGSETFTVKVSTGFYDNPAQGLPSNDGLMLVLCARTGRPLALLQDLGWLTGLRTAIAGRIVARLMAPTRVETIGMLGTGEQARLQLAQLLAVTECRQVVVWGRDSQRVADYQAYAEALGCTVTAAATPEAVARASNLIVTTTPSRVPLLQQDWIQPGTHITAVGADARGKQELATALVARADRVMVDAWSQCSAYGEIAQAVADQRLDRQRVVELGQVLAGNVEARTGAEQITIADLTGVAIQDAQIARAAWLGLTRQM